MLIDVLYTVLSALPVVSHVQLFLEPYAVSQVLAFSEAFPLSPGYPVHPFDVDLLYRMYTSAAHALPVG